MKMYEKWLVVSLRRALAVGMLFLAGLLCTVAVSAGSVLPNSFADLAEELGPTVVNVYSTQVIKSNNLPYNYFFNDNDLPDLFKHFFNNPPQRKEYRNLPEQKRSSLGSGVIISSDGYIVTNNHVVENADTINVKLSNMEEYEATIIGRDEKTDLALIKIVPKHSLIAANFGNSNDLRVGDWVLAIGNPFGFERTVTAGIVSGKGRSLGDGPYQNFIQTDASINPGNSGGPLFDTNGKLMGINTAIYSRSGGNIGLGFAIPVDMVQNVVSQLKGTGTVIRGMLGVMIQPITNDLANQFGLERAIGALVSQVVPKSPAEKAGILPGDIILSYQGKEITQMSMLPALVAQTPVGKNSSVTIFRNGRKKTLPVTIAQLQEGEQQENAVEQGVLQQKELGLTVRELNEKLAESLGLEDSKGVLVTVVEPGSISYNSGLKKGDVILEAGVGSKRKEISTIHDLNKIIRKAVKKKSNILLRVRSDNRMKFAILKIN